MKKAYLAILITLFMALTSCINTDGPSYIDSIDCFINGELATGTVQYYDEENASWFDYNNANKRKLNVYYKVDVRLGDSVEIIFNFYNPKLMIQEVKAVFSKDFTYTYKTDHYFLEEKEEEHAKLIINIGKFNDSFNVIRITSWMTNRGIKYQGTKNKDNNYSLWGIHFKEY